MPYPGPPSILNALPITAPKDPPRTLLVNRVQLRHVLVRRRQAIGRVGALGPERRLRVDFAPWQVLTLGSFWEDPERVGQFQIALSKGKGLVIPSESRPTPKKP